MEHKTYEAKEFYKTIVIQGASFNNDETKILTSTDETGIYNAYSIDLKSLKKEMLTNSKIDSIYAETYFPLDDRFVFEKDQGGNELTHVFIKEKDGSEKDLIPIEKAKAQFVCFSRDNQYFYVTSNERDQKYFDLYKYSTSDYKRELIYKNTDNVYIVSVSGDGRFAALIKSISNSRADIYLIDLKNLSKAPFVIKSDKSDVEHHFFAFSPDSKKMLYSTNEFSEFDEVWALDLFTHEKTAFYKAKWDVMFANYSYNGKYYTVGVNDDGITKISIFETKTKKQIKLPEIPDAEIKYAKFSKSEEKLILVVNTDTSPTNLYYLNLNNNEKQNSSLVKLTDSMNPNIDTKYLVDGKIVYYPSYDGLKIPAIIYKPRLSSEKNKVPAVLWIHGGPGGQTRKGYSSVIQHLVNNGFAVFAVNNRGSSGYGKTFFHMDDKKHGDVDLKDCVYAKKYLQTLDYINKDKIGIMGGSYGGYMVLAALAFTPKEFDLGIDIFGVSNWIRTLTQIPPWWEAGKKSLYDEMGDPKEDHDRLVAISPLFHAKNIIKPLLVIQGANDPRVLKSESDEIVEAVKGNNVPVEYVLFDDEGHGFNKKKNRIEASEKYLGFLNKYF